MGYEDIKTPLDLKRLDISELGDVAQSVRGRIISVVDKNGGHLSSNLGAVELTIALHYVFDCPKDHIVFDVGHQCYAHKILTGRGEAFDGLRKNDGISGFPKPSESEYDCFGTGHASTSLSVALGLAQAAKLKGEDRAAVAVIGDGALTGGMAYEALNEIGSEQLPVIIVLNDNEMSISKNVGAMSKYLTRLRISKKYTRLKNEIHRAVSIIPFFGDGAIKLLEKSKKLLRRMLLSNKMFESMGIGYYGPFDGHNMRELIGVFSRFKHTKEPVLLHVITDKGHGLNSAISDPAHYHGVSAPSQKGKSFSDELGSFLLDAALKDERVMAITAAMSIGTGLEEFAKLYPLRFRDVGIAEEHAATYSAALASAGLKPYLAIYSTFLQRAYDQVLHDICIGGYPVTLCVDRAGAAGDDGVTHQGVFDLSFLSAIPGMTVMSPADGNDLRSMLEFSLSFNGPLAIRYPKSYYTQRQHSPVELGKWEIIKKNKSNLYALCVGSRMLDIAEEAAQEQSINIINCRFVKPFDEEFLRSINKSGVKIVTLEDNIKRGGFGEGVLSFLNSIGKKASLAILAHPDSFIDDRSVDSTMRTSGITAQNLITTLKNLE